MEKVLITASKRSEWNECRDGAGIVLDRDCYGITLSANVIAHHQGGGKTKRPIEHANPIQRDGATGILLQSTSDIVISGNQFSGLIGPAIRNEGKSKRLSVSGNIVTDMKQSANGKTKAFSLGKPSSSVAKDNIVADE